MIDFIKKFLMVDKDIHRVSDLEQMNFEDRLDYFKNNSAKLHSQPREMDTIHFL